MMRLEQFRPKSRRRARFFNALVSVYGLSTNCTYGSYSERMKKIETDINNFLNGAWLPIYNPKNLVCIDYSKVRKFRPHRRRKKAVFYALLAYIDAAFSLDGFQPCFPSTNDEDIIGSVFGEGASHFMRILRSQEVADILKPCENIVCGAVNRLLGFYTEDDAEEVYGDEIEEEPIEVRARVQVTFEGLVEFDIETTSDKDIRDEVMTALSDYVDTNNVSVKITELRIP